MAEYQELVQALTWLLTNRIQQKMDYTHGLLGDGNGRVRVSTTPGSPEVDYVYVRPDRFSNRAFKVFNKRVEGQDGDPVIIGELPWEPDLIQVIDLDWAAYADIGWGDDVTTTNRHGISHQWRDGAPGLDTFNVYRRQFGDLKTYPAISGTLAVGVSPYSLDIYGTQYQWPGIQAFSLGGAVPAGTGTARMALVYWSPASGTSGFLGVASGTVGSSADATFLNRPVTPQGAIPSAFVRLKGGQTSVTEFDIWDAREPFRPGLSFNTGSYGLSALNIPIADNSALYTGTTVEAALEQIGFDGARVSKVYESDFGAVALQADATGQIGVGIAAPDGTLHVHTATAGTVAPIAGADDLTIENSSDAGLTVLTPDNSNGRVAFGSPSDNDYGVMLANYNSGSPYVELYAGPVSMLKLTNDTQDLVEIGDVAGTGDVDINFNSGQMTLIGVSGHASIPYRLSVGTTTLSDNLLVQGQAAGNATMGFYAGDGDGTDFVSLVFYGVGTPGSIANRERLIIQYNQLVPNFRIQSEAAGTGTLRPLVFEVGSNANQLQLGTDGNIAINTTNTTLAKFLVNQNSATAAVPTIYLQQSDLSEEFIRFNTTVGAGNPIDTAAVGTFYGKARVSVNGTFKYVALYNS